MPDPTIDPTTGEGAGAAQKQEPQTTEPPAGKTFTQEQINAAVKEEKKQWQSKMKDLQSKADEWDKLQEANKSELEKITGERDTHKTEAQQAKLEAVKLRALVKAGADPDKIDALLKRVVGSTPEEIEADVKELQELGLLQPRQTTMGSTTNPANSQKKDPSIDEKIAEAEKAGRWGIATELKLQKQREMFKS